MRERYSLRLFSSRAGQFDEMNKKNVKLNERHIDRPAVNQRIDKIA